MHMCDVWAVLWGWSVVSQVWYLVRLFWRNIQHHLEHKYVIAVITPKFSRLRIIIIRCGVCLGYDIFQCYVCMPAIFYRCPNGITVGSMSG